MSYTSRITERLGIVTPALVGGTAAMTATSGTIDMETARRAIAILQGGGTGTATVRLEAGYLGTSTTGVPTTWSTLVVGTASGTASVTTGQVKTIEVRADQMPSGARYLRSYVTNGSGNTYAALTLLTDSERYSQSSQTAITEEIDFS